MHHYKRRYTQGKVAPYAKKYKGKEGKLRWQGSIREGVVTEAVDKNGRTIREENGSVKLVTKWRTLMKTFGDIDCVPYKYRGTTKYRGQRDAEAAFQKWREDLLAKADEDYEEAIRLDETEAKAKEFNFSAMMVPEFVDLYIREREEDGLEASTLEGYGYSAKTIKEHFGDVPIGEITADDLKEFNRMLKNRGLSATTRSKALKFFKFAYDAHRTQIGSYPFADCKKWWPHPKKADPNPLDATSLEKVMSDIENSQPTGFMCAVEIALRTSMRIGEICGLKWENVNMDTGAIYVCNAIGRVKGGTVCYEKAPKYTGRDEDHDPTRDVPGSPKLKAMFARRFDYMVAELKRVNKRLSDEEARVIVGGMYVVGSVDGRHANPTVFGRTWRGYSQGLMGTKGRRPTFHALRDTWISQAITKGHIDPVTVAKIAGHADPGFTMRTYADSQDETMTQAQTVMDSIL